VRGICSAFLATQMKIETIEPSEAEVPRAFLEKEGKSLRSGTKHRQGLDEDENIGCSVRLHLRNVGASERRRTKSASFQLSFQ
jgi:hypothetical protein